LILFQPTQASAFSKHIMFAQQCPHAHHTSFFHAVHTLISTTIFTQHFSSHTHPPHGSRVFFITSAPACFTTHTGFITHHFGHHCISQAITHTPSASFFHHSTHIRAGFTHFFEGHHFTIPHSSHHSFFISHILHSHHHIGLQQPCFPSIFSTQQGGNSSTHTQFPTQHNFAAIPHQGIWAPRPSQAKSKPIQGPFQAKAIFSRSTIGASPLGLGWAKVRHSPFHNTTPNSSHSPQQFFSQQGPGSIFSRFNPTHNKQPKLGHHFGGAHLGFLFPFNLGVQFFPPSFFNFGHPQAPKVSPGWGFGTRFHRFGYPRATTPWQPQHHWGLALGIFPQAKGLVLQFHPVSHNDNPGNPS